MARNLIYFITILPSEKKGTKTTPPVLSYKISNAAVSNGHLLT